MKHVSKYKLGNSLSHLPLILLIVRSFPNLSNIYWRKSNICIFSTFISKYTSFTFCTSRSSNSFTQLNALTIAFVRRTLFIFTEEIACLYFNEKIYLLDAFLISKKCGINVYWSYTVLFVTSYRGQRKRMKKIINNRK